MSKCALVIVALLCGLLLAGCASVKNPYPDFSLLPVRTNTPDPMVMMDGSRVGSSAQWVKRRRPELQGLFQHYMYGVFPPAPEHPQFVVENVDKDFLGGKAVKKEITISFAEDSPKIHLLLVIPHATASTSASLKARGAPVFLALNFTNRESLLTNSKIWALDQSLERGYAVATFFCADIEPDRTNSTTGLRAYLRQHSNSNELGVIGAWAWGISRAVDYLVTDPDLDPQRIAVVGHSRLGKATMVAAAFDDRIALAVPLQAGCGGTAPSRSQVGESVKAINTHFPHWFNQEFKKFNDQPERLPFDQNCLIALAAPRHVLIGCATEDTWANPKGQFAMMRAANPVYLMLGVEGLPVDEMPAVRQLVGGHLAYFIRPGKHSMTREDWKFFLDYADKALP